MGGLDFARYGWGRSSVASNREDLGYALGMVTFLGGAFLWFISGC